MREKKLESKKIRSLVSLYARIFVLLKLTFVFNLFNLTTGTS